MTPVRDRSEIICHEGRVMVPTGATIVEIAEESSNTRTYYLQLDDPDLRQRYHFQPGQFNMVYVFGVGEAAISISSDPVQPERIAHTIRHVGSVTRAIAKMRIGDKLALRGPFGNGWPVKECRNRDVVMVAGGIGLAPLRPFIYSLLANRDHYGRLVLMYGGRSPADLLFRNELSAWHNEGRLDTLVSGALQLRSLHTELVTNGGWTEKAFHDAVLQSGPMPVELIRARLNGAGLPRDHQANWRF